MAQVMYQHAPPLPDSASSLCGSDAPDAERDQELPSSFFFPARPADPAQLSPDTGFHPAPSFRSHRRARTSINATPLYGLSPPSLPSTSVSASSPISPTQLAFVDGRQSPRRSKHRRMVSEFSGGHDLQTQYPMRSARGTDDPVLNVLHSTDPNIVTHKGHRHRRSDAVSSKGLASPLISQTVNVSPIASNEERAVSESSTIPFEGPHASPTRKRRQSTSATDLPRTVGFSDTVEIIARPISMVSLESASSQSTIRASSSLSLDHLSDWSEEQSGAADDLESMHDHASAFPHQGRDLSQFDVTESDLIANFDDESLDSAETASLDWTVQWSPADCDSSTASGSALQHASAAQRPVDENPGSVIDLDLASTTCGNRPATASAYERQRSNIYSTHSADGRLTNGNMKHRRAESAPLLAPPSMLGSFRSGVKPGGSANEHVLQDVFEEDEEDEGEDIVKGIGSRSLDNLTSTAPSFATQSGFCQTSQSAPCLLAAIEFNLATPPKEEGRVLASSSHSHDLPVPPAPFAEMRPDSASSSPAWTQHGSSPCGAGPRYRKSVDDIPSLISGSSDSFMHPNFAASSSTSFEPGRAISSSSCSVVSLSKKSHNKRLSIISLSRWVGGHAKGDDTHPQLDTPQTSSGFKPLRTSKGRRLSRFLNFWKSPKVEGGAWGSVER